MIGGGLLDNSDRTRVLVVMNSSAAVEDIRGILQGASDLAVVGTAVGTASGLDWLRRSNADIVLVENGPELVSFTNQAKAISPATGILLLGNAHHQTGAQHVVEALTAGAFDFANVVGGGEGFSPLLLSKIRCFSIKRYSRMAKFEGIVPASAHPVEASRHSRSRTPASVRDAILVGVSTGGPEALMELLSGMDPSFPVPVVVVLHMPREFTPAMASSLDRKCRIRVVEAQDGVALSAGTVHLAQGGRHCLVERGADGGLRVRLGDGPPENGCRPSVDVLFRSGAAVLGSRCVGVILTGMGSDGTEGSREVKGGGGIVLVQDERSSVVWGMPGSVVRAGVADEVVPLGAMATRLTEIVGGTP